jgi:hypothetical protein
LVSIRTGGRISSSFQFISFFVLVEDREDKRIENAAETGATEGGWEF